MRRQAIAADGARDGSSRLFRLDPLSLPVSYVADDDAADGGTRTVELRRNGVEVRRVVRGVSMRLKLPLEEYLGIAVRVVSDGQRDPLIYIALEHRDAALSALLQISVDSCEAAIDARKWSRTFQKPILIAGKDGRLRNPASVRRSPKSLGRRRRRSALRNRRATIHARRKANRSDRAATIHSGEREIIARN